MERCSRFLHVLFCICCTIAVLAILSWNGYAVAAAVFLGLWALMRRRTIPHFTLWLFVGGLALRLVLITLLRPPLESDFWMLYTAAQGLLEGGNILTTSPIYFSWWAYQSVSVLWEAFWLRLWNDPLCLKLVNAVLCSGTVCLLYRMLRRWVSRSAAQTAALLLTLYPSFSTYHVVLFNGVPSAFFLTLGLWVLVCEDCDRLKFWRYPLAGLCVEFGSLLRTDGIIVVVAALVWVVFSCFRHRETAKRVLLGGVAFMVVLLAVQSGTDAALKASGLNPYGIANLVPQWKVMVGLNRETSGCYSVDDAQWMTSLMGEDGLPTEETYETMNKIIKERLSVGPGALLNLAYQKLQILWEYDHLYFAWRTGGSQWAGERMIHSDYVYLQTRSYDWGLMALAFGLALFGLLRKGWREKYPAAAYLPYFVFFAALCALLPIEIQAHYTYLARIYVFGATAFGLDRLVPGEKPSQAGPALEEGGAALEETGPAPEGDGSTLEGEGSASGESEPV